MDNDTKLIIISCLICLLIGFVCGAGLIYESNMQTTEEQVLHVEYMFDRLLNNTLMTHIHPDMTLRQAINGYKAYAMTGAGGGIVGISQSRAMLAGQIRSMCGARPFNQEQDDVHYFDTDKFDKCYLEAIS